MRRTYRTEPLDLIQVINMDRQHPMVHCTAHLTGIIDLERMHRAVRWLTRFIPQILCAYDEKRSRWISFDLTEQDVVRLSTGKTHEGKDGEPDFLSGPQFKVGVEQCADSAILYLYGSHILCDGAGFKQMLYLICEAYNRDDPEWPVPENQRSAAPVLFRHPDYRAGALPEGFTHISLPFEQGMVKTPHTVSCSISAPEFHIIRRRVKDYGATLNDLIMAAYAWQLYLLTGCNNFYLPCPVDLRRFIENENGYSVANLTGNYLCPINIGTGEAFEDLLKQVHESMSQLKKNRAYLYQLPLLHNLRWLLPPSTFLKQLKANGSFLPITYSNIGVIDDERFSFHGTVMESVRLSGAYKPTPTFQLAVSTFKGICTFSTNMIGTDADAQIAGRILQGVKETVESIV